MTLREIACKIYDGDAGYVYKVDNKYKFINCSNMPSFLEDNNTPWAYISPETGRGLFIEEIIYIIKKRIKGF